MFLRTITLSVVLFLTLALPLAAFAVECHAVIVAFENRSDRLEIINLDPHTARILQILFYANDGTLLRDSLFLPALPANARVLVTAKELYATFGGGFVPKFDETYVRLSLQGNAPFAMWLLSGGQKTEVGCLAPPVILGS